MRLPFAKYHGAGNDFVLVDDRAGAWAPHEHAAAIAWLCARHTGIGADGLLLLRHDPTRAAAALEMVYYNADGAPSSFCGNGSRCFVAFARELGLVEPGETFPFRANDGLHRGRLGADGRVAVSMRIAAGVTRLGEREDHVDTGSPHFIRWASELPTGDIAPAARRVRYGEAYAETGVNVNFATEEGPGRLAVRTYERGVEGETLACGTGVTAAALSFADRHALTGRLHVDVRALGGELGVRFTRSAGGELDDVWLTGPARRVFGGEVSASDLPPAG